MNFWILLFIAVAVILVLPFVRLMCKRVVMSFKLQKLCKKNCYKLFPTHPFWMLGSKRGHKCDFYIETDRRIFSVKLFCVMPKKATLVFTDKGNFFVRRYIYFMSYGGGIASPIDGKQQKYTDYDFRHGFRNEWETRSHRSILLIYPISTEIRLQYGHGEEKLLGCGEFINNSEIQSLSGLISELERQYVRATPPAQV